MAGWQPPGPGRRRYTGVYQAPDEEEARHIGIDPAELAELRDPRIALHRFGVVVDQASGGVIPYDADAICPELQHTMLNFIGDTPKDADGMNMYLFELGPRQSGKSVTAALAADNHAGRVPGQTVITIADVQDRVDDLFRKTTVSYDHQREHFPAYAPAASPHAETKKRSYPSINSTYYTLSTHRGAVGIGRSPDFAHISEAPFHKDFGDFMFKFMPSVRNRAEVILISETTPAPGTEPSAPAAQELAELAMAGESRWLFHFTPYYASALNEREWRAGDTLDNHEVDLLNRFGPRGNQLISGRRLLTHLTLENLAFRRAVLKEDQVIRRYPELFDVFYPLDPISCWTRSGGGVIPSHVLTKHLQGILVPWTPGVQFAVYRDPRPGARYVIGVDPAGYGSDHASFEILEVWAGELIQCVEFSCPSVAPTEFANIIADYAEKYNGALVGVERNGVGIAVTERLKTLREEGKRFTLYFAHMGVDAKPGFYSTKQTNEQALAKVIDELMNRLVLYSQSLVAQLGSYRNDKAVEDSEKYQLLNPGKLGSGRRGKHHWDRVSALGFACLLAQVVPASARPAHVDTNHGAYDPAGATGRETHTWTLKDQRAYQQVLAREERRNTAAKHRGVRRDEKRKPKTLAIRGGRKKW